MQLNVLNDLAKAKRRWTGKNSNVLIRLKWSTEALAPREGCTWWSAWPSCRPDPWASPPLWLHPPHSGNCLYALRKSSVVALREHPPIQSEWTVPCKRSPLQDKVHLMIVQGMFADDQCSPRDVDPWSSVKSYRPNWIPGLTGSRRSHLWV